LAKRDAASNNRKSGVSDCDQHVKKIFGYFSTFLAFGFSSVAIPALLRRRMPLLDVLGQHLCDRSRDKSIVSAAKFAGLGGEKGFAHSRRGEHFQHVWGKGGPDYYTRHPLLQQGDDLGHAPFIEGEVKPTG
jgi:hypothetical protein